jgi:phage terminase large subunit-like protein
MTVDQRQELKIWQNCVAELYDRAKRPENLEIETEEAVDTDQKTLASCTVQWEMAIEEVRDKKALYLWMYSDCWEKMVSN